MNTSIHSPSGPSSSCYSVIPKHTMSALLLYANEGIPPGSFLRAVLSSDLFGAFERADRENIVAMIFIVRFIYCEMPGDSWGSPAIVDAYIAKKRAEKEAQFGLEPETK